MKRSILKRVGWGTLTAVLFAVALVLVITYTGANRFPNADKQHAMLRLEDVGPGGLYGSLEGLGQLRAVLEYLASEDMPYHVAVISRRIALEGDGTWTERGIDDAEPDAVVTQFIRLLQEAQQNGGVPGMHGYSHQYGDTARADNGHNSGTGSEFQIKGVPGTHTPEYAASRIMNSLAAFEKAGLRPAFWESPHYHDTRKQEEVFRSYMGILYQPDMFSLRSFKDLNMYESVNRYGQKSLGSVYVPAPFKYIGGEADVTRVLNKAKKDDGLAALYFHPYMDFEFLEPVVENDGQPQLRDGLPVYRYREGAKSYLHRIVDGFREEGYRWMSLHDIVPFSPAHRVTIPPDTDAGEMLLGDVTGRGGADIVIREQHRINVIPGDYTWPRNRPQAASEVWLKHGYAPTEQLLLSDWNADDRADLIAYDAATGIIRVAFSRGSHFAQPEPAGTLPAQLTDLQPFNFGGEDGAGLTAVAGSKILSIRNAEGGLAAQDAASIPADSKLLTGAMYSAGRQDLILLSPNNRELSVLQPNGEPQPIEGLGSISKSDRLLFGDPNGDGLTDVIVYTPRTGVWRVYENEGGLRFRQIPNDYGPWASGDTYVPLTADFDGNGKTDIAAYDPAAQTLDLSLSFRDSSRP